MSKRKVSFEDEDNSGRVISTYQKKSKKQKVETLDVIIFMRDTWLPTTPTIVSELVSNAIVPENSEVINKKKR